MDRKTVSVKLYTSARDGPVQVDCMRSYQVDHCVRFPHLFFITIVTETVSDDCAADSRACCLNEAGKISVLTGIIAATADGVASLMKSRRVSELRRRYVGGGFISERDGAARSVKYCHGFPPRVRHLRKHAALYTNNGTS